MRLARSRGVFLLLLAALLSACGHNEVLEPFGATPQAGVDFTGLWELRAGESADNLSIMRAIDSTDGVKNDRSARSSGMGRPSGRSNSGLVHVFLETGRQLKVTQTPYAFFVSIDRAVVEEFRFGEQRMVNVGEIEAQRVSGWDGATYVVETLDKRGMKLTEKFWLSEDRNTLNREITFRSRKLETASVTQLFDRVTEGR